MGATPFPLTVDEIELKAPDDAELEIEGRATITETATGAILVSDITVREVEVGNEFAKLDIEGSLSLNADTDALSGTITSLELEFLDDDPLTPETEFRFVELKGRVGVTGDLFGDLVLSGAFTSVEVGPKATPRSRPAGATTTSRPARAMTRSSPGTARTTSSPTAATTT